MPGFARSKQVVPQLGPALHRGTVPLKRGIRVFSDQGGESSRAMAQSRHRPRESALRTANAMRSSPRGQLKLEFSPIFSGDYVGCRRAWTRRQPRFARQSRRQPRFARQSRRRRVGAANPCSNRCFRLWDSPAPAAASSWPRAFNSASVTQPLSLHLQTQTPGACAASAMPCG